MKIRELMAGKLHSVAPGTSIEQAARLMAEMDVGVLPVLDGAKLAGIVTDRDIAVRAVGGGIGSEAPVEQIMTAKVATCGEEDDIEDVLEAMADIQVRRMPVRAADGNVVGIFSIGDAAREDTDEDEVAQALRGICRPGRRHSQAFFTA